MSIGWDLLGLRVGGWLVGLGLPPKEHSGYIIPSFFGSKHPLLLPKLVVMSIGWDLLGLQLEVGWLGWGCLLRNTLGISSLPFLVVKHILLGNYSVDM